MRKTIVIDFDDTLVDTRKAITQLYEEATGDRVDDNFSHQYLDFCKKWSESDLGPLFEDKKLFDILSPIDDNCEAAIKYLRHIGYDLVLCSLHRCNGIKEKQHRLHELFGEDTFKNTIFLTNLKDNKDYVVADVFIDDNLHNLSTNNSKVRILFDKYHLYPTKLVEEMGIIHVHNWFGVIKKGGF